MKRISYVILILFFSGCIPKSSISTYIHKKQNKTISNNYLVKKHLDVETEELIKNKERIFTRKANLKVQEAIKIMQDDYGRKEITNKDNLYEKYYDALIDY